MESEGAKADRECRPILDPEHQRPQDDARKSRGTLEHCQPLDDAVRRLHHAVRCADRQNAPRDALDQEQPGTRAISDDQCQSQ